MIKRLGALILAVSIVVGTLMLNAPVKTAYASASGFGGYYEMHDKHGVIQFDGNVGNVTSAVISGVDTNGQQMTKNVSVTVDGAKVTIGELSSSVTDSMVLGEYYTLTINGTDAKMFRFVTKAIANKDDLQVLKLTSQEKAITGYYVLANDLKLEKGEELYHDVNGSESGHGIYYATYGFRGTFDGQGHNVEFWANDTGFFGALSIDGVIKNTAFVNVHVYTPGTNPVLFHAATWLYVSPAENIDDRALVENVYIRMAEGNVPEGAICHNGSIPLKLQNVVLEFPGANVDHNTGDTSIGALWGADYGWWTTKNNGMEMAEVYDPLSYKDVYIIGRMPASHYKYIHPDNSERKKGFYAHADGTLGRGWMEGYAENEGVEEDIFNGNKVYKGVRKYATLALLSEDKANKYDTFNKEYWAIEEYGLPVWKNGVESNFNIFLETNAPKTSVAIFFELGGEKTAKIGFGLGGISVEGTVLDFEFIKGEEFISINSRTGVITAKKEGVSQFWVKCTYNGKTFQKKYTVYVSIGKGYIPPYVYVLCSVGGAVLVGGVATLIVLKKKKSKKQ